MFIEMLWILILQKYVKKSKNHFWRYFYIFLLLAFYWSEKMTEMKDSNEINAVKKKKSKELQWIMENLKTKPEVKSKDSIDGATVNESAIRAYGEIEFKGATKRAKSKVSLIFF